MNADSGARPKADSNWKRRVASRVPAKVDASSSHKYRGATHPMRPRQHAGGTSTQRETHPKRIRPWNDKGRNACITLTDAEAEHNAVHDERGEAPTERPDEQRGDARQQHRHVVDVHVVDAREAREDAARRAPHRVAHACKYAVQ